MTIWPAISSKKLIHILNKNGWILKRQKGSHQIFFNNTINKSIIIAF
ncbi:MAG: type II toxin-antitoxin system HicA family toxin [Deltaproteobacteria bacterium]|nr:type II toxin-antitoxin system HicA family toxin [Deltaproteobacteria bacterium]